MERSDTSAKVASNDQLGPIAWMVTTEDGADAYVTADPSLAHAGQRALPLYAEVPAVQLELERTAAALAIELAEARHAAKKREPLNFDQLQSVMSRHFGGRDLTDDEADSAEAFARAVERAHGIGG